MTTNKVTELNQEDEHDSPSTSEHYDEPCIHGGKKVLKSGPLFLSSRGIGWTSWKKRWFILTRTSLVFFRSDPNVLQSGNEVNLTLGGIDLNNTGRVTVKADKKLLIVSFPDGRDGRTFTLKAETIDDLNEWKAVLEVALAQAPSPTHLMRDSFFRNDHADTSDDYQDSSFDAHTIRFAAVGKPILLALEDVDGHPSFLEKALRFIEEHGIKLEGILRQAADVEDVEGRIKEYEQGKTEFSADEDAHVVADCIKYFLRELPSSPVPASCCNALLEAFRTDRGNRVKAMRSAICETFPDPNRRLLKRILLMMQAVAQHRAENRMSVSAVAACMAPLLLRPLLAGDCELEAHIDIGGDGSIQLLQAAAAANHAHAIIITLLEEYDSIFSEGSISMELFSDSEDSESGDEVTEDDESYEDEHDSAKESDESIADNVSDGSCSNSRNRSEDDNLDNKGFSYSSSGSKSLETISDSKVKHEMLSNWVQASSLSNEDDTSPNITGPSTDTFSTLGSDSILVAGSPLSVSQRTRSGDLVRGSRERTVWGRTSAKKNLSLESIDYPSEDEVEIQKLEMSKIELQNRISEEVKGNAILQANLEKRKQALRERRVALEQDVARLQEKLQEERNKRVFLEAGLNITQTPSEIATAVDDNVKEELDEITKAELDVNNLKQRVDDMIIQLNKKQQSHGHINIPGNRALNKHHQSKPNIGLKDAQSTKTPDDVGTTACQDPSSDLTEKGIYDSCLFSKHASQNQQQLNSTFGNFTKPISIFNSKRLNSRSEGVNSTASALSKLTTRLNFLKERRTQIATELQDLSKTQAKGPAITASSNSDKTTVSIHKSSKRGKGSEGSTSQKSGTHTLHSAEDSRQSSSRSSTSSSGKGKHVDDAQSSGLSEGHEAHSSSKTHGNHVATTPRSKSK